MERLFEITMPKTETLDLRRGMYRRQYAGFRSGRRICSVSLEAEAWFWRVRASADDFGNAPATPELLYQLAVGRRFASVSIEQHAEFVCALERAGLICLYSDDGEDFFHVLDWLAIEPAPRNGRRIRMYPAWPGEEEEARRGIRGSPGESGGYQDQDQEQDQNAQAALASAEVAKPRRSPAARPRATSSAEGSREADESPPGPSTADSDPVLLTLPCIPGRSKDPREWPLRKSMVDEWTQIFPGVDVLAVCRRAVEWLASHPRQIKTFRGMRAWLGTTWLSREQDRPRPETSGLKASRELPRDRARRLEVADATREHGVPGTAATELSDQFPHATDGELRLAWDCCQRHDPAVFVAAVRQHSVDLGAKKYRPSPAELQRLCRSIEQAQRKTEPSARLTDSRREADEIAAEDRRLDDKLAQMSDEQLAALTEQAIAAAAETTRPAARQALRRRGTARSSPLLKSLIGKFLEGRGALASSA